MSAPAAHPSSLPPAVGAELAEIASRDPLTGLASRGGLEQELPALLARSAAAGHAAALLHIDLDDFELINDSLGSAVGDELLRQVARRLGSLAGAGDLLARTGGDEFLLAIPSLPGSGLEAAETVAQEVSD